jgi:hypothetical protein
LTLRSAARDTVSSAQASLTVWFDAFTQNVDRTARNANLLVWHRKLYLIDHGAALYFHHNWETMAQKIESPFAEIAQHVLLPWASQIEEAANHAHAALGEDVFVNILKQVPDEWLVSDPIEASRVEVTPVEATPAAKRAAYVDFFVRRLDASKIFEQEAMRAHAQLV